jgi:hypothetical protein
MNNQQQNTHISKEEMDAYAAEAQKRWGHTQAFKQSQERVQKMGQEGLNQVIAEAKILTEEIAKAMSQGFDPKSKLAQTLISRHYTGLKAFYEPNLPLYRSMAKMYLDDPRFTANYEKIAPGLAQFMHDSMIHFANTNEGTSM